MNKKHTITIRLSDAELEALDEITQRRGLNDRSATVRYMISRVSGHSEEDDLQRFFRDTKSLMNISAKNSEIALELLNAICISSGTEAYDSKIRKSEALVEASMNVNNRIAERTKYKNNARTKNPAAPSQE